MTIQGSFPLSLIQTTTPPQSSALGDLLLRSSPIAKAVLIILLLFSIYSWTIIIAKWLWLRRASQATSDFLSRFRKATKLSELYSSIDSGNRSPIARVFIAGYDEIASQAGEGGGRIRSIESLNRVLQSATILEVSQMERSLSWLATTANASPFIGLFGTVVGIIIAFQGLSGSQASSIQAVAPGIAEALIATAAGIAAAVPSAIFYNHFLNRIKTITATLDRFSLELLNMVEKYYIKAGV